MVAFCAVLHAMTAPGQTVGISVFIDPMMESLDLSRTAISTAYLIGTIVSAMTLPRIGTFIDLQGSRVSIALSGGLLGVVLMMMSGVSGIVTLTCGFVAIRLFGQGSLSLVASNALAPWFVRRRGFALGISTAVGTSLILLVPVGSASLIDRLGWRITWVALAIAVWVVTLPIAFLGIVNHPRDLGQTPDGGAPTEGPDQPRGIPARVEYSRRRALGTTMYWVIAAATVATSAIGTGLRFHQIAILGEQGLSTLEAASNFLAQAAGTLGATVVVGSLVDRASVRWLVVGSMGLLAATILSVGLTGPGTSAIAYGLILGSATGSIRILESATTPRLFGLRHLGAIRGFTKLLGVAASAVGPLLIALASDLTGSFEAGLNWFLIAPAGVTVAALFAAMPGQEPAARRV